jgi:hypothetical protein
MTGDRGSASLWKSLFFPTCFAGYDIQVESDGKAIGKKHADTVIDGGCLRKFNTLPSFWGTPPRTKRAPGFPLSTS